MPSFLLVCAMILIALLMYHIYTLNNRLRHLEKRQATIEEGRDEILLNELYNTIWYIKKCAADIFTIKTEFFPRIITSHRSNEDVIKPLTQISDLISIIHSATYHLSVRAESLHDLFALNYSKDPLIRERERDEYIWNDEKVVPGELEIEKEA